MATTVNFLDVIKSNSFGAKTVTIDVDLTNITLHVQFRKEQKHIVTFAIISSAFK